MGLDGVHSYWWYVNSVLHLVWALQRLEASKTIAYMYTVPFATLLWTWIVLSLFPTGGQRLVGLS